MDGIALRLSVVVATDTPDLRDGREKTRAGTRVREGTAPTRLGHPDRHLRIRKRGRGAVDAGLSGLETARAY